MGIAGEEQAIRAAHAAWVEAVNAGDLAALDRLMSEDALFLAPGRPPLGRSGFAETFLAAHRTLQIRCESVLQEVSIAGGLACALSQDMLAVAPRSGGEATALAGHRMTLYRKQPDGRWLLARDAHTLTAEKA